MSSENVHIFDLPSTRQAARWARNAVAELMPPAGVADDIALVVSELVTNAVTHGAPPVVLGIMELADRWVIEVCDGSYHHPQMRPVNRGDALEGGRGIQIVDWLSSSWGVRSEPLGKCVWADMALAGTR